MNHFPLPLIGKFVGKNRWKLTEPFEYCITDRFSIVVPIGFISDGASIPEFAWSLIGSPWSGKYSEAAVIHDFLYFEGKGKRKIADKIFLYGMKILGVSLWKRLLMYRIVRLCGWVCWNRKK